ncbi:MAG TPA: hypothetical protein VLQ48_00130 [Chloroflexia bacterium]|nr:hypothetical protein [Chloroflexia bacterium]
MVANLTNLTTVVKLDKIASATRTANLTHEVEVSRIITAERGNVLVVEALEEQSVYGELELESGRMARIIKGDLIAGVLGERQALKGFVGYVPSRIGPGDVLHMLNMGGVIGLCSSANADFGQPLRVRVVGAVISNGVPANIGRHAVPWQTSLPHSAPIILLSGTCMNSGKTTAACEIIKGLKSRGYRIAVAKLAGVATQRDLLNMLDHGAIAAMSFSDAGLPSTTHTDNCLVPAAKGILAALNEQHPDAIVVEFGDGIMGHYGVDILLGDAELMGHVRAHVLCANDLVATWGGLLFLSQLGLEVDCVSGPTTDNSAGIDYIQGRFNKQAVNARSTSGVLANLIAGKLFGAAPGELAQARVLSAEF